MLMENSRLKPAASLTLLLATFSLSILSLGQATAAPLRYAPKEKAKIAYKIEIVADLPERIQTHKGNILFEVTSIGELIKLQYSGDLTNTSERKKTEDHLVGPGHFFHHRRRGHTVSGMMNMKNRVSLTPRGEMNSISGSSQLPYLLGNLSLFVFEPLPEKDQKSWSSKNNVAIVERYRHGWWGFPFPHSPHSIFDKRTAATESEDFKFESKKGDLSTFRKTYKLHAAEDKDSITITGNGTWVFNHRLNLPESFDCKYEMTFKNDNLTLSVPVIVKYNRLSEKEIAAAKKKKEELRKQSKAKHEKHIALQKAPIKGEERQQILIDLTSDNIHKLHSTLSKLSQKSVRDDKEIANAIKPLLKHSSSIVRDNAADAIAKFAPKLGHKIKLNKDYSSTRNVDITGAQVTDRTLLPAGLIVAVNEHGTWYTAAKIVRKLKDGQVEIQLNRSNLNKTIHYSKIRLAPPEVDQPFVSKRMLAKLGLSNNSHDDNTDMDAGDNDYDDDADTNTHEPTEKSQRGYRPWTDDSGTFAIIAKYVSSDGKTIKLLRKKDGKEISVPLSRLSEADRKVAQRLKNKPIPSNPFE